MERYLLCTRLAWLWAAVSLVAVSVLGVSNGATAQAVIAGSACPNKALYVTLRQHQMPNVIGCSAVLVSRAFEEIRLPLRVDGAGGGVEAIFFATHLEPVPDVPIVSQRPDPGSALAGMTAEISLTSSQPVPVVQPILTPDIPADKDIVAAPLIQVKSHRHILPISFSISPISATLTEGETVKAVVRRTGFAARNQAIVVVFVDSAKCARPPVRRSQLIFKPGQQTASVTSILCVDHIAPASRRASITLVSPPRGSLITAAGLNVTVIKKTKPPMWRWLLLALGGAVGIMVVSTMRQVRFRRRWRHGLPMPFPVTAACRVNLAPPAVVAQPSAGLAISITVQTKIDHAVVDRNPGKTS